VIYAEQANLNLTGALEKEKQPHKKEKLVEQVKNREE